MAPELPSNLFEEHFRLMERANLLTEQYRFLLQDWAPDDVIELRILLKNGKTRARHFPVAQLGEFVRQGLYQDELQTYAIYNPLRPEILDEDAERGWSKCVTAADVLEYRILCFDVDFKQPIVGGSRLRRPTSNVERSLVNQVQQNVQSGLAQLGWPPPIIADTGNCCHLLNRIQLPPTDASYELLRRLLRGLNAAFGVKRPDGEQLVEIDDMLAGRVQPLRFYGGRNRKGEPTPDRPHRESGMCYLPPKLDIVSQELLEACIKKYPPPPEPARTVTAVPRARPTRSSKVDDALRWRIHRYLEKRPVAVSGAHGHIEAFKVALVLACDWNLDLDDSREFFEFWNELHPENERWSEAEIAHKLADAQRLKALPKNAGRIGRLSKQSSYYDDTPIRAQRRR